MNDHVCDFNGLELDVKFSGDVGEPKKFFDGGKYGRDRVSGMVCHLLGDLLALEDFVGHQMNVVVFEVS